MQDYCSVVLLGDCVLLHMISVSIVSFLVPLAKTEPLCILSQIWKIWELRGRSARSKLAHNCDLCRHVTPVRSAAVPPARDSVVDG